MSSLIEADKSKLLIGNLTQAIEVLSDKRKFDKFNPKIKDRVDKLISLIKDKKCLGELGYLIDNPYYLAGLCINFIENQNMWKTYRKIYNYKKYRENLYSMHNFSERLMKCFSNVPSFYHSGKWDDIINIEKNPITEDENNLIPVAKEFLKEVEFNLSQYHGKVPDHIAQQTSQRYAKKANMSEMDFSGTLVSRLKAAKLV